MCYQYGNKLLLSLLLLPFNNREVCYLFLNKDRVTIIIPKIGNKEMNT